jgi:hypothetical protein
LSNHVAVDPVEHRDLKVMASPDEGLGDSIMACPTLPIEFRRVQNEFPILFQRNVESGRFAAFALMGFEDGENLFFEDGRWTARYRPLVLAVQPFLIGRSTQSGGQSQVHINLDHPRVGDPEGVRLFDDNGEPSPHLDTVRDMLNQLDVGLADSAGFYDALERYQLLEPFALDIALDDGSEHRLVGYHLIDEDRLQRLESGALAELHRDNYLMPIFMALASLSNVPDLVARKNRRQGRG